jgi:TetR/AcrR family transcriptional regulator, tetracycline repressor protein
MFTGGKRSEAFVAGQAPEPGRTEVTSQAPEARQVQAPEARQAQAPGPRETEAGTTPQPEQPQPRQRESRLHVQPQSPEPPPPPWRSAPLRRGIPRPQLSREVVVRAALQVVESVGGEGLSMRRVADKLGVSASALYGYVASKEELVQLMLDRIIEEVPVPSTDQSWQDMLRHVGRETLKVYRRHPGVAVLTLGRVPVGPSIFLGAEVMLSMLRSAGMPDEVAVYAGDLGALYVAAFAYELDLNAETNQSEESAAQFGEWLSSLPADRFPNIVALAPKMVAGSLEDRFEWGMDVIIRGLGTYLDDPPTRAARWPVAGD